MSQFKINNLKKSFKSGSISTEALKGVSMTVQEGDTVAIVGASGAGKSTLLHIMGTIDFPSSGDVFFEGVNLFGMKEDNLCEFRNRTIGFVFQFHHLLMDFTALENVMMPLYIRKESKKEAFKKSINLLERVGLANRADHKATELSGGEQQRVAIARALVGSPQIILADEPTGNLDTDMGQKVFDLLLSLNRELKTTLVVVTHNEDLVTKLNTKIKLTDGKIESSF